MRDTALRDLIARAAAADQASDEDLEKAAAVTAQEEDDKVQALIDDIDEALPELEKRASQIGAAKVLMALDLLSNL